MATQAMRHLAAMLQPWLEHDEDDLDLGRGDLVERSMYSWNNETVANINVNNDKWSVTVAPSAAPTPMQSAGTNITDESVVAPGEIPWWWTVMFIFSFFLMVCVSMTLRELCARWCGGSCGPTSYWPQDTWPHSRHSVRHRIGNDTPTTSEDRKEAKLQKQRQERRLWYQYYLKPYTVVLTEGDFVTDGKLEDTSLEKEEMPDLEMGTSVTKDTEASDKEADLNNEDADGALVTVDLESGDNEKTADKVPESTETTATPTGLSMDADPFGDNRTMCLWDPHDSRYRCFEASCTICYEDYEVGDVLVHSATNEDEEYCRHVFHRDCMLAWLEKGKKRCPICRHWFVPSVRIHDQMKEAHVATNPDSLRHLYDDRTMEAFATLNVEDVESTSSNSHSGDMDDVEAGTNADPLRGDANMHHHHHHHPDNHRGDPHRGDANMNHSHNYQTPPANANPFLQSRYRPAASLADLARHAQITLYGPDATSPPPTFPAAQPHHHHRQATWDPASHAMGALPLPAPVPPLREHSEGFLVGSAPARDPASLAMALPQGDVTDDLSDGPVVSSYHRRRHTSPAELLHYQADIRSWAIPDEAVVSN